MKPVILFFEINSIERPEQSAFKDILITEEASSNNAPYEISFKVPNASIPIKFDVWCGTILYSGVTEKGGMYYSVESEQN